MNKRTIGILLGISLLASCSSNNATTKSEATSETGGTKQEEQMPAKKERAIVRKHVNIPREFSYITNISSADIIFTPGDYSVEMEGDSILVQNTKTDFDSNLLTIGMKSDANSDYNYYGNENNTKIYISAPTLACISICSTGGFVCTDTWKAEQVQIGILGTGSLSIPSIDCNSFIIESTGNSKADIGHLKAYVATITSRGQGEFAINCDVNELVVINEGQQKLTLTGIAKTKSISNKKDKNLKDMTK